MKWTECNESEDRSTCDQQIGNTSVYQTQHPPPPQMMVKVQQRKQWYNAIAKTFREDKGRELYEGSRTLAVQPEA
jgi:hypothetical protein